MTRPWIVAIVGALAALTASLAIAAPPDRSAIESANRKYVSQLREAIAGRENEPAEQLFDDIQIFKGWTAGRLIDIMENGFSPALGVSCTHCHKDAEWDATNDRKTVARGMWKMMIETNRRLRDVTWGEGSVSCYTCHRGKTAPATSPEQERGQ